MSRTSLLAPLAVAVSLALVGCGTTPNATTRQAEALGASRAPLIKPQPAKPVSPTKTDAAKPDATKKDGDVNVLGAWNGRIGGRLARIWVPYPNAIEADMEGIRFSGQAWPTRVVGTLYRPGFGPQAVSLSIFGAMIDGRVGVRSVNATFAQGGWLVGRAGERRCSLSVLPNAINGQMAGLSVWMSGVWYQPGEEWGVAAALLALMAGL
ncbi:MAG: hypothetical protein VKP62_04040 [Candidatus Sericytochromatia bacterium]|nr:hypothetical protein [Candidatus Sericytochromatia bacterium]